jgi:flagellar biosynthetic protein FliO
MDIVRQSLAIALVFALLGAALWLLRRRGAPAFPHRRTAHPGVLESRGRLMLSAQHSVHWVQIADRNLVLGVHPTGVTLLCELAGVPDGSRT